MQPDSKREFAHAAGLDLFPITLVACGSPGEPAARLLKLQSAVARWIGKLAALRLTSLRLPRQVWPRLHAH